MRHRKRWWIRALALLGVMHCIPWALAKQTDPLRNVSFEVKFLLDENKVLTEQHLPTEALAEQLALEECRQIDVIYLETADKAFSKAGWVNRIRWKTWKKKPERAYKLRYAVEGTDQPAIHAALDRVRADGLDVGNGDMSIEIDWVYSQMTLSAIWEVSGKCRDFQSLYQFSTQDALDFAASAMPPQEIDWKRDGWGRETLAQAQKIGPLKLLRAKGTWAETKVELDIIFIAENMAPVVELSFEAEDLRTATEKRSGLMAYLEGLGILLTEDSLKTQAVIDAYLLKEASEETNVTRSNAIEHTE